jgi:hypothetical protein
MFASIETTEGYTMLPFTIKSFSVPQWMSNSAAIGLLRQIVIEQLKLENKRSKQNGLPELWALRLRDSTSNCEMGVSVRASVSATGSVETYCCDERIMRTMERGIFLDVCGPTKWRSEMYPVYTDPFGIHHHPAHHGSKEDGLNYTFEMGRSACALFGIVSYGVHMNIYEEMA